MESEIVLQENLVDFRTVPDLKRRVSRSERRPCVFQGDESAGPTLLEAAQTVEVLFGNTWTCESGFSETNHIKNMLYLPEPRSNNAQITIYENHIKTAPTTEPFNSNGDAWYFLPELTALARGEIVGKCLTLAKNRLQNPDREP